MALNKSILARAIRIIDAVSQNDQGLRFSEASRLLGFPSPATVNKILKELVGEGVLKKTSANRYLLGRKVYFWGRVMAAQNTPVQIIRQHMRYLYEHYRISVNMFTCVGETMFCMESYLDSQSPMLYPAGKSLPLRLNIQGAVFFYSAETLDDPGFLKREAESNDEPISVADLQKMISQAQLNHLQDDFGLFYPGVRRFAIPLNEQGRTVMVLGVGLSAKRARDTQLVHQIVTDLDSIRKTIEELFEQP